VLLNKAATASIASCAPWNVALGKPPSASERLSGVSLPAAGKSLPVSCSVRSEAQAIDVVQPRQRNRASTIRPSTIRAASFKTSPQTGLLTSTTAVASHNSPALRGLRKWSRTASLNISGKYGKGSVGTATECRSVRVHYFLEGKYFF